MRHITTALLLAAALGLAAYAKPAPDGRHHVYAGTYSRAMTGEPVEKLKVSLDFVAIGASKAIAYQGLTEQKSAGGAKPASVWQLWEHNPGSPTTDPVVGSLAPQLLPVIDRRLKKGVKWTLKSGPAPGLPAGTPLTLTVTGQEKAGSKLCWVVSVKPTAGLPLMAGPIRVTQCEQKLWVDTAGGEVHRTSVVIRASGKQGAQTLTMKVAMDLRLQQVGTYPAAKLAARKREFAAYQALDNKLRAAFASRPDLKTVDGLIKTVNAHQKKYARGAYVKAVASIADSLRSARRIVTSAPRGGGGSTLVGKRAPRISLKTLEGKTISLSGLKGKVVLLNFFASW